MSSADERAQARAQWPARKVTLAALDDPQAPLDAQSAWRAVLELTAETWGLSGALETALPRAAWPTRLYQPGEPRPDSHGL